MKSRCLTFFLLPFYFLLFTSVLGLGWSPAWAGDLPEDATFTTRAITPFAIEGLTMDATGNFYTTGRQPDTTKKCPVWRISPNGASRVSVGFIQNNPACNPSGIAFDSGDNLYIVDAASGGIVWTVTPDPAGCASDDSTDPLCAAIPNATAFATGVPGTNGLAFDQDGDLWTGDGTTGQGRVWEITGPGANCAPPTPVNCEEVFRIQPMNNSVNFGGVVANPGVGRANTTIPGTAQNLVANGVAFDEDGHLFVADTARGAIWRVKFKDDGSLKSKTGCDETFTPNTLCLDNIFVAHPFLEGTDGIALDKDGNIWNSANERNAIVVVTEDRKVVEVFRNDPDATTHLRNTGPLEFPASPFISGKTLCTSNSDGGRRDNSPNTAGEIKPAGPDRGKISCMEPELEERGLRLPVQ